MPASYKERLHKGYAQVLEISGKPLADEKSRYQKIRIFDTPSNGRVMTLDNILQISTRDESAYAEMLTHLPMFEHGKVERVMIVGGGDLSIADEALKHSRVKEVVLVDIDGRVVELCKEYFGEINAKAFKDKRLKIEIADAFEYLGRKESKARFDLIVADRPDPVGPGKALFGETFYDRIKTALKPGGFATFQTGVPFYQPEEITEALDRTEAVLRAVRPLPHRGADLYRGLHGTDLGRQGPEAGHACRCRARQIRLQAQQDQDRLLQCRHPWRRLCAARMDQAADAMTAPNVAPLGPRTLTGRFVALEPITEHHHAALKAAGSDPDLFRFVPPAGDASDFATWIGHVRRATEKGTRLAYAIRRLADGAIVGSSSYLDILEADARVEIGSTWYTAEVQGSAVNPEAKLLLLENAFNAGYNCVFLKTDFEECALAGGNIETRRQRGWDPARAFVERARLFP